MRLCGGAFARIFQNLDDCDKLSLRLGTNVASRILLVGISPMYRLRKNADSANNIYDKHKQTAKR